MDELEQISRETATDYHQVTLDRPIEEALMRLSPVEEESELDEFSKTQRQLGLSP